MNVETIKPDALTFTAQIDDRNRITVPKSVVDVLLISKGDKLTLTVNLAFRVIK